MSQPIETRFGDFDDPNHPANQWWEEHGQYMMAGGGRREFIWACRGWIAREQLACGVPVTGESTREDAAMRAEAGDGACPDCGHAAHPTSVCSHQTNGLFCFCGAKDADKVSTTLRDAPVAQPEPPVGCDGPFPETQAEIAEGRRHAKSVTMNAKCVTGPPARTLRPGSAQQWRLTHDLPPELLVECNFWTDYKAESFAAQFQTPGTSQQVPRESNICPRCEGTGNYQRLPNSQITKCAVCEGTGKIAPAAPSPAGEHGLDHAVIDRITGYTGWMTCKCTYCAPLKEFNAHVYRETMREVLAFIGKFPLALMSSGVHKVEAWLREQIRKEE